MPPSLSVFSTKSTRTRTGSFMLFPRIRWLLFWNIFSVLPPGGWGEYEPNSVYREKHTKLTTRFPFSNEIRPDDVGMNIFMSDTEEKGDGCKSTE